MDGKGGLVAMTQRLFDLFADLDQIISLADQRRVRGSPQRVVQDSLQATAGIINAQAKEESGEVQSDGVAPSDSIVF